MLLFTHPINVPSILHAKQQFDQGLDLVEVVRNTRTVYVDGCLIMLGNVESKCDV